MISAAEGMEWNGMEWIVKCHFIDCVLYCILVVLRNREGISVSVKVN